MKILKDILTLKIGFIKGEKTDMKEIMYFCRVIS